MALYRTLGPVTYVNGDRIEQITRAGVVIDLSPEQAAQLVGSIALDRSGPFSFPKAEVLKYDSSVFFPVEGESRFLYYASDSGLFYQWIEDGYSTVSGTVTSVNGEAGIVVLDADDIDDATTTHKFVSAAEKTKLANTSGTNTGDQDLSGLVPVTRTVNTKALSSDVTLTQDDVGDGTTYKRYSATEKSKLASVANNATANDTDANLKNRVNHTGTQTASTISDFNSTVDSRISAAAGTTLATLVGGLIPTSQIPAAALTTVQTAASQAAMLALTAQEGDVVIRSDEHKSYMKNNGTSGTMSDWTLLDSPSGAVTSVNSQTGTVVLGKADIGLGNVDNTADVNKAVLSATKLASARTVQTNLASTSSASFDGSANITPGVTGTLPVGNGGTGAATLTGIVKGNGTSAFTAATAGTDYVTPSGSITGNAATATKLATARNINGVAFDGSANITVADSTKQPLTETVNTVATSGSSQTIPDPATGATMSRITLTANCTLTFPTAAAGKSFYLALGQDATGSRTVTWPTIQWPGGVTPTLTTTPSKVDRFAFLCDDGTNWVGFTSGLNF